MKRSHLLFMFLAGILCLQCVSNKKVTYEIPADYPEARRKQILEICEKGKELYKTNCADCHGIFTKGKDKVPNFSATQLDNYSSRFIRRDPQNHAIAMQMSPEQLNEVILFLKYKKVKKVDTVKAVTKN